MTRIRIVLSIAFALGLTSACSQEPAKTEPAKVEPAPAAQAAPAAAPAAKKEHVFRGKIEGVDPKAKTLMVNGENVEGWMPAMTMVYKADKDDVYAKVKAGDRITARVFDGIEDVLYDVQVIP